VHKNKIVKDIKNLLIYLYILAL